MRGYRSLLYGVCYGISGGGVIGGRRSLRHSSGSGSGSVPINSREVIVTKLPRRLIHYHRGFLVALLLLAVCNDAEVQGCRG